MLDTLMVTAVTDWNSIYQMVLSLDLGGPTQPTQIHALSVALTAAPLLLKDDVVLLMS